MSKIGDLGNIPSWWDGDATRATFLKPSPTFPGRGEIGPLEPYGYPAYEGYGYPGAGYGTARSKVVGLEYAKVSAPQLTNKGWEGKVPVGTRVTSMGTLNPSSDRFTRAEISVLQGLRGLGQAMTEPQAETLRLQQADSVIAQADQLITAMQRQVASPPLGTYASSISGWKTAVNTAVDVRARLNASKFAAAKSNEQFKKWLDAANALTSLGREVVKQYDQNGLINALRYTAYETVKTVGTGVADASGRALTILDWLTKPYVFIPVGLGLAAVYVYARGGGSIFAPSRTR